MLGPASQGSRPTPTWTTSAPPPLPWGTLPVSPLKGSTDTEAEMEGFEHHEQVWDFTLQALGTRRVHPGSRLAALCTPRKTAGGDR